MIGLPEPPHISTRVLSFSVSCTTATWVPTMPSAGPDFHRPAVPKPACVVDAPRTIAMATRPALRLAVTKTCALGRHLAFDNAATETAACGDRTTKDPPRDDEGGQRGAFVHEGRR